MMKTDIQIAQEAELMHIKDVAASIGISEEELEFYGKYKAKLSDELWENVKDRKDGKLVLVTAINPTPAGEGKTTITVGLGEAFAKMRIICWLPCWIITFSRAMHWELIREILSGNAAWT